MHTYQIISLFVLVLALIFIPGSIILISMRHTRMPLWMALLPMLGAVASAVSIATEVTTCTHVAMSCFRPLVEGYNATLIARRELKYSEDYTRRKLDYNAKLISIENTRDALTQDLSLKGVGVAWHIEDGRVQANGLYYIPAVTIAYLIFLFTCVSFFIVAVLLRRSQGNGGHVQGKDACS